VIGALVSAALAPPVHAAPAAFDAQLFHPTTQTDQFVSVQGGETPGPWTSTTGLVMDFALHPLHLDVPSQQLPPADIVAYRVDAHLISELGITMRGSLAVAMPVTVFQSGTDNSFSREKLQMQGIKSLVQGDLVVRAKYQLLNMHSDSPAVAVGLDLHVPTGASGKLAGQGTMVYEPFVAASFRFDRNSVAANLSMAFRATPERLSDYTIGNQLDYGLGLSHLLAVGARERATTVLVELAGATLLKAPFGLTGKSLAAANTAELRLALRQKVGMWGGPVSLVIGVGAGLLRGYGEPLGRIFLGVDGTSADPLSDRDADGVPDIRDYCPDVPEDLDGFEDDDGCPDLDNDKDGIPDEDDLCPNEPEDMDGFEDSDGCPDVDNDWDGIPDSRDACPDQPEDYNGIQDQDGCPDEPKQLASWQDESLHLQGAILFIPAQVGLKKDSLPVIEQVAAVVKAHPEIAYLQIIVHPERSGKHYSQLAAERGRALKTLLTTHGVNPNRLQVQTPAFDKRYAGKVDVQSHVLSMSPGKGP